MNYAIELSHFNGKCASPLIFELKISVPDVHPPFSIQSVNAAIKLKESFKIILFLAIATNGMNSFRFYLLSILYRNLRNVLCVESQRHCVIIVLSEPKKKKKKKRTTTFFCCYNFCDRCRKESISVKRAILIGMITIIGKRLVSAWKLPSNINKSTTKTRLCYFCVNETTKITVSAKIEQQFSLSQLSICPSALTNGS